MLRFALDAKESIFEPEGYKVLVYVSDTITYAHLTAKFIVMISESSEYVDIEVHLSSHSIGYIYDEIQKPNVINHLVYLEENIRKYFEENVKQILKEENYDIVIEDI